MTLLTLILNFVTVIIFSSTTSKSSVRHSRHNKTAGIYLYLGQTFEPVLVSDALLLIHAPFRDVDAPQVQRPPGGFSVEPVLQSTAI
jgi:hypothetical protein